MDNPIAPESCARTTKVAQVAYVIKQRIKRGVYSPGDQLPSIRSLGLDLNLTSPTIQRAVKQLEAEGVLESQHGVGVRVLESADCRATPLIFGFVQPYINRFSLNLHQYLEDALDSRSNLCVVKSTRKDAERERQQIEKLINCGVNGLLIWPVGGDTNAEFLRDVVRRLPVVFVDCTVTGVHAPSVVLAYRDLGRQIVRRLAKIGRGRLLTVCDPVNISTFNELRAGMRDEADRLEGKCSVTFVDQPVIQIIEQSYEREFELADRCYETVAPLLRSGQFDAIFSPSGEFFDIVFAQGSRMEILRNLLRVGLTEREGQSQWRSPYEVDVEEWIIDNPKMMLLALDLLQDMTLRRTTTARSIRVPFTRARG
ncbi:MAG: GntR family transcriptional regulator [Capsulimonadaceae bacterium]|nr:GntR family transcriptional regulator [Capsulimonadaceae bacterium]